MQLLAATSGVFGETAAGVALGALREAVARGQLGERDRVVLLVTGTGLKTPSAVEVSSSAEIAPDVDELLDHLGAAIHG
jgi:threonine synthase